MIVVGVLALQGAFTKHIEVMQSLGVQVVEVRKATDLDQCQALIIPGGESTTIMRRIEFIGMEQKLLDFAKHNPVFGTCAGLILMACKIANSGQTPYQLLDITVERNAFGRQIDSFRADIDLHIKPVKTFPAFFIRAPRILKWGPHVKILATYNQEPVLVQEGHHLGASFHPELTEDPSIHQYFLEMIRKFHHS